MKPDKTQLKMMQDHKTPGMSLTAPKTQQFPFTRPPEIVDKQEALQYVWDKISSKDSLPQLIKLLRRDVPVVDIASVFAKAGFAEGKWNTDLSLQLVEPAAFMIMHIARKAGVDYVFSKEIPDLNAYARGENEEFLKKAMDSRQDVGMLTEEPSMETDEMEMSDDGSGGGLMSPEEENIGGLM